MKSTVSVLLASSMVLNPMNGIQIAVGSEQDQTRIDISGLINKKVNINLDSDALKTAALAAIQESNVYSVGNYLSTDTATDAAFENLMNEENPFYELQLWSSEEESQMAENGVDVKILVQRDSKIVKEEKENADAPATKSQLKKSDVSFMYDAHDAKSGQELAFYQPDSYLGTLLTDFQADKLYHETAEAEEALDNSSYELTGDETITILYMNTDKTAHTFKLLVDGKTYSTGVKVAGTESLAKSILNKLKITIKEDLTGTSAADEGSATASNIETKAETAAATEAAVETNAVASDASTEAETGESTTAAESNAVESTTETAADVTESTEETTAESTTAEAQTAEVSQEETVNKEAAAEEKTEKRSEAEKLAEDITKEVEQLTAENTVTRIGAFTLDKFFDEAEAEEVKTEGTTAEDTTDTTAAEENTEAAEETTKEIETEKNTEAETTAEASTENKEETTAVETTAESTKAKSEETTAVETAAAETEEETKAAEAKAITAMDESLAEERKETLKTVSAKDLAEEIISAKAVQYTLGDLTSDFKSADLGAYLVKVYPVTENAIEADWKLEVKELLRDEQEAKADNADENSTPMSEATKKALQDAGIYDNSRSLDIKLVDKDGNEVEPNGTVKVEIEMDRSLYDEVDSTDLTFYHLEEDQDGNITNVVQVADSSKTEALNAQGETIARDVAVVTKTVENTEAVAAVSETEEESTETSTEVKAFAEDVAKLKTSFEVESFSPFSWVTNSKGKVNEGVLADINISLYNYKQGKSSTTGQNELNSPINGKILSTKTKNENNSDYFLLNVQDEDAGRQNKYVQTGQGAYQGIMKDEYDANGRLQSNYKLGGLDGAYNLFPDADEAENLTDVMSSYINVNKGDNVLQRDYANANHYVLKGSKDNSGDGTNTYFAYDASTNTLTGSTDNKNSAPKAGFWPFGNDYGYGMKMSFDFGLPSDGKISNENMVFKFAGDDDVWVYLTKKGTEGEKGKLALDIGGIHGAIGGSIDFATGLITVNKVKTSNGENTAECYWYLYQATDLTENKLTIGSSSYTISKSVGLTRPTSGMDTYKLDFYYMERGGNESNCYIDFTLPVVPQKSVNIIKNIQEKTENEHKNTKYNFKVYSSTDEKKLEALKTELNNKQEPTEDNLKDITVSDKTDAGTDLTITGANSATTSKITVGDWFFIAEEVGGEKARTWTLTDKSGDSKSGSTICTDLVQMTENGGYVLSYTNIYGELDPTIAKRAWKDYTTENNYDLTLQVTGDTITTTSTTTTNADPVDVVFVVDKSNSIGKDAFAEMKKAIADISSRLPTGSKVACVAFSNDIEGKDSTSTGHPTYDQERANQYYKNVFNGWLSAENVSGNAALERLGISTGTHTAAGLAGAKTLLQSTSVSGDGNKKLLILMTDGKPNRYVDENGKYWNNKNNDKAVEAAVAQLGAARAYADAAYAIKYRYSDSDESSKWLSTENFKACYEANNYSELLKAFESITTTTKTDVHVTNPVVTDQLSSAVDMVLAEQTASADSEEYEVPAFWVKDAVVSGTNNTTDTSISDKGTQCTLQSVTTNDEGQKIATYSLDDVNGAVTYNLSTRTITWKVASSLPSGSTKTLVYSVTAVASTDAIAKGDTDTGTHVGEYGYKSNTSATLTYDGGNKTFPHPVVVPTRKLTVSKTITGDAAEAGKAFKFQLDLSSNASTANFIDLIKQVYPDATWQADSNVITFSLTPEQLATAKSTTITLPAGTKYQVSEEYVSGYTTKVAIDGGNAADRTKDVKTSLIAATDSAQTLSNDTTVAFTNDKTMPVPTGVHRDVRPYVAAMAIALAGAALLLLENERRKRLGR